MKQKTASRQLLKRLNVYLDHLKTLPDSLVNVSATAIAKALSLGDVQVRKDLARVSGGGQRRVGHNRQQLIQDIENYLDLSTVTPAILVFSGHPGASLLEYSGFEKYSLKVQAGFDLLYSPGKTASQCPIYPIDELENYCRLHDVHIGMIAVPAKHAQQVCDRLCACGIRAIWNFSPTHLNAPDSVAVRSENLTVSATALRIQLQERQKT